MSTTEYKKIFANRSVRQEAQVRGREIVSTASANSASRINSLDMTRNVSNRVISGFANKPQQATK